MAKATRVHSTPRRTASKIQIKKRTDKANLFGTPPTSHLVVLGDDRPSASVARAEQIVDLLTVCYVRKGWKIDAAAAKRALAYVRRQEDVAAILAAIPECPPIVPVEKTPEPYRPAQSTVDAFRLVAAGGDVECLKAWLVDRPKDAPLLLALLESPASC
jgi:hypothetical protein